MSGCPCTVKNVIELGIFVKNRGRKVEYKVRDRSSGNPRIKER